jgi:hypothetical protein
VQPLKKGTHKAPGPPPEKNENENAIISVFLASGNKIPRLSQLQKSRGVFWGKILGFV